MVTKIPSGNWLVKAIDAYITTEPHERAAGPKKGTCIGIADWHELFTYLLETPALLDKSLLQDRTDKRRPLDATWPGYSLVKYRNDHRSLGNIQSMHAVVYDFDHFSGTFDALIDKLQHIGFACFLHTTASHGCDGKTKARAIFPLEKPTSVIPDWEFTFDKIALLLEENGCGPRDWSAVDAAHFWYKPCKIIGVDYQVQIIEGRFLKVAVAPKRYKRPARTRVDTDRAPAASGPHIILPPALQGTERLSGKYDIGWVHRQMGAYLSVPVGERGAWLGAKYTTLAGLYGSGSFVTELSESTILETIIYYVMMNAGRSYKEEYASLVRAWEKGKARPLESKKKSPAAKSPVKETVSQGEVVTKIAGLVLLRSTSNKIYRNIENFRRLLRASPIGRNLFYNQILQRICVYDESPEGWRSYLEGADAEQINHWIGVTGVGEWPDIPKNERMSLVESLAKERSVNPFRDNCEKFKWDGVPRVDTVLITYAKAEDTELNRLNSKNLFISLVARACSDEPVKVDTVLVLEGAQGCGKSRFVQAIGGAYYIAYSGKYTSDRSTYLTLQGALVVELSELAGLNKQDVESAKAFFSMSENVYEMKYMNINVRDPRKFIVVATTNKEIYLSDDTGNRRYNGVRVGKIDVEGFEKDRDQILAEAYTRWKRGEVWWFESEAQEQLALQAQEEREQEIPYLSVIQTWLLQSHPWALTTTILIDKCLCIDKQYWTKTLSNQIADIMRKIGYKSSTPWVDGVKTRVWVRNTTSVPEA